jgi:hypothetical protein
MSAKPQSMTDDRLHKRRMEIHAFAGDLPNEGHAPLNKSSAAAEPA